MKRQKLEALTINICKRLQIDVSVFFDLTQFGQLNQPISSRFAVPDGSTYTFSPEVKP
jgi:hypothetical protein